MIENIKKWIEKYVYDASEILFKIIQQSKHTRQIWEFGKYNGFLHDTLLRIGNLVVFLPISIQEKTVTPKM